ncbi:hypothetical protein PanWU01x14_134700 [Parasponia andersonii]|uniref:Uncharacterized protein n=1 Tax=Parasponia andersonii TaxID=3476 RepID=A0A2P5CPQ8_PARAD|nr:hypothetical protein PanWU01x14_134700 [Parasponia andersonii]
MVSGGAVLVLKAFVHNIKGEDEFLMKTMQTKSTAKYEEKIQELTTQCQLKAKECCETWILLTTSNEQLDKVRMDWVFRIFATQFGYFPLFAS